MHVRHTLTQIDRILYLVRCVEWWGKKISSACLLNLNNKFWLWFFLLWQVYRYINRPTLQFNLINLSSVSMIYFWICRKRKTLVSLHRCFSSSVLTALSKYITRPDPGFLERGRGVRFVNFRPFSQIFLKYPHKNEITWYERGVRANPLNPLWICPCITQYSKALFSPNAAAK